MDEERQETPEEERQRKIDERLAEVYKGTVEMGYTRVEVRDARAEPVARRSARIFRILGRSSGGGKTEHPTRSGTTSGDRDPVAATGGLLAARQRADRPA